MRPRSCYVSQPVRSIQTMLRVIGMKKDSAATLIPDGIYSQQTMSAVSGFQRRAGLPVTGVTDDLTWARITREFDPAAVEANAAQPLDVILQPWQVIGKGQSDPCVHLVQGMLLLLSQVYSSVLPPSMTGTVDLPTSGSLASFPALCSLPETGELDKITWKCLVLHYPLASNLSRIRKSRG